MECTYYIYGGDFMAEDLPEGADSYSDARTLVFTMDYQKLPEGLKEPEMKERLQRLPEPGPNERKVVQVGISISDYECLVVVVK